VNISNEIIISFIDDYMSIILDAPDLSIAKSGVRDWGFI